MNELTTTVCGLKATVEDLKRTNEDLHKRADEKLGLILDSIAGLTNVQASDPALAPSTSTGVAKNDPSAYLKNPPVTPELTTIVTLVVSGACDRVEKKKEDQHPLINSMKVKKVFRC